MRPLVVAAVLAMAWPAAAQAVDLGGGMAPASFRRAHGDLTIVTLRTAATGQVMVRAVVSAPCGTGRVRHRVTPAADGSFSFAVTVRRRAAPGVRQVSRITVAGRVVGAAAAGTAKAKIRFRRRGRIVERCNSGTDAWQARAAAAQPAPAPPRADGAYYGTTSQTSGRPRGVIVRVAGGGKRVATAVFEYRNTCRKRFFDRENVTPGATIAADGSFSLRERFTIRYSDATERFRVKVDGRFTTTGVNGTLSVTSIAKSRATGAVIDRCSTGRRTFAAAL